MTCRGPTRGQKALGQDRPQQDLGPKMEIVEVMNGDQAVGRDLLGEARVVGWEAAHLGRGDHCA